MIAIISSILGLLSGFLPVLIKLLEKRMDYKYELEITKMRIEAAYRGYELSVLSESIKADVEEGKSLRDHDSSLTGNEFLENLRASIRPVLTYAFFFLFLFVKVIAIFLMINTGASVVEMLNTVWDVYTISIFGSIIGFWFGNRSMLAMSNMYTKNPGMFKVTKDITDNRRK